ncbi:thiolase family protein [Vagococcus humatus]|uniref:acetyl-CoA C-acetyltransferase n=1 Tax=Vagococcus humatus TaxID=1889241 RepID=A0A429Z6T4_9ENTE|nr:thiolase family protein [Vagococcus humatus]RST89401.1 acetyl-CoA C-acyltransferase [Vagococcus humatus]
MPKEVVILSAKRTPIGKYRGAFKEVSAVDLGVVATQAALAEAKLDPKEVDQVIFGQGLQAGLGQNPARQVQLAVNIPQTAPSMTINEVCGSGLKAIILGQQVIQLGKAQVVVVGGMENMTQTPLYYPKALKKADFQADQLVDGMIQDGLTDAFNQKHMGLTAELLAETYHISREEQDQHALNSHQKAFKAQQQGQFEQEIAPVLLPDGTYLKADETVKKQLTYTELADLPPVFKKDGSVTAGNASSLNDGAAVLILADKEYALKQGWDFIASLGDYSEIGNDPNFMGYSPVIAIKELLQTTQKKIEDINLFEINEAFSVQSLTVNQALELPVEKVNIHGGAVALGHPIGASGARIMTTLIHSLKANQTGIASTCIGGGLGIALEVKKA